MKAAETTMKNSLPPLFHVEGSCVWSFQRVASILNEQIMSLCGRLARLQHNIGYDLEDLMLQLHDHYVAFGQFRQYGVLESDLSQWKRLLDDNAVITPLDKGKHSLCILCPQAWQERARSAAFGHMDHPTSRIVLDTTDFPMAAIALQTHLGYSGLVMRDVNRHQVGMFDIWPKESGLRTKARPLGSYFRHCLKNIFSLTCRALNFLCVYLCPDSYSVLSAQRVVDKFYEYNLQANDYRSRGYIPLTFHFKRDIDNFFNNIPRDQIGKAVQWFISRWLDVVGKRRRYIMIPKLQRITKTETPHCFTRSFRGHWRNLAKQSKPQARPHNSRVVPKDAHILHIDDIMKIINFDLNYGYLAFGNTIFVPTQGMTQGSNLSPGVCNLVCVYLEHEQNRIPGIIKMPEVQFMVISISRWVDDIFGIVSLWVHPCFDDLDVTKVFDDILARLNFIYESASLTLKVEDASTFVGFDVSLSNGNVALAPTSKVGNLSQRLCLSIPIPRFQCWHSNRTIKQRTSTLQGLVICTIDRCLGVDPSLPLLNLFLELHCLEFPLTIIRKAVHAVKRRHPYLRCLDIALHNTVAKLQSTGGSDG